MIARVLDIPDDDAALAAWLDDQIAGPNLHEFVAELAAVHDAAPRGSATADEASAWLGDSLADVLDRGMGALDRRRLGELLRTPRLLPGLQELVLVEGGRHWDSVVGRMAAPRGFSTDDLLGRIAGRSGSGTAADTTPSPAPSSNGPSAADAPAAASDDRGSSPLPASVVPAPSAEVRHGGRKLLPLLAGLAASALVAMAAWSLMRPQMPQREAEIAVRPPAASAPWGWNRPEALAAAAPEKYLENLAAAASEWSAERPATAEALGRRLDELLAGCDRLIAAPHEPLAADDRAWLLEKCMMWREKIAGHVAALGDSHDVTVVLREADTTVEKLTAALRTRAADVRNRPGAA